MKQIRRSAYLCTLSDNQKQGLVLLLLICFILKYFFLFPKRVRKILQSLSVREEFIMKAVITVVGQDKTGIIAKVSNVLYENDINILDISQTIMEDMFTMIMMVDMKSAKTREVTEKLGKVSEEMGVSIHLQNEEVFKSMHRI